MQLFLSQLNTQVRFRSLLLLAALAGIGTTWLFFNTPSIQAQGACVIESPAFTPRGDSGSAVRVDGDFHEDGNPASIQFSVQARDCGGSSVEVSLYSHTTKIGDISYSVPADAQGAERLAGSVDTGEIGCSATANPNCRLSIRASVDGQTVLNTFQSQNGNYSNNTDDILGYSCWSACDVPFGDIQAVPVNWDTGGDDSSPTPEQVSFARLQNPIAYDNIPDVIRQLITIVFIIGVPLVALAIIYAGFLLVTAGGDQNKLTKGKQALLAGVLGGAILLGAWVIAEAIQGTVDQIRGV